jgi:hypothetical protein
MQWKQQKGGICETTIKDGDKKFKVKVFLIKQTKV